MKHCYILLVTEACLMIVWFITKFIFEHKTNMQIENKKERLVSEWEVQTTVHMDVDHRRPNVTRHSVKGSESWLYVTDLHRDDFIVHKRVWLDTRDNIHQAPCLWVRLLYPKTLFSTPSYFTKVVHHQGYITYNNRVYGLSGQSAGYTEPRCDKWEIVTVCRFVVYFKLPFAATYDDFVKLLSRRFVYRLNIKGYQSIVNELDIEIPVKGTGRKRDFLLCTKPLFGTFSDHKVKDMVEWVEMNRILGISQIHMYNMSLKMTSVLNKFFTYYEKDGFLKLNQEQNPLSNTGNPTRIQSDLLMFTSVGDCFFRNIYLYRYIVVLDTDELIIPVQYSSLNEFLDLHVHKVPSLYNKAMSLSSEWALFFNHTNITTSKVLSCTEYYQPAEPAINKKRVKLLQWYKSITSMETCPYIGQHKCYVHNPGYKLNVRVPYDVLRTHHYRGKCKRPVHCLPERLKSMNYTDRYHRELLTRLNKVYSLMKL